MKMKTLAAFLLSAGLLAACSNSATTSNNANSAAASEILTGNEFTLTAKKANLQVNSQVNKEVWTFNGSVPGPQIRVKLGEKVKVDLKNELSEPVSIHWHGYPVPFQMDGIPGMTMNAVQPGGTYTYEFTASVPGTYWYHSHQDSVNQLDKGLYGTFVVEADEPKPDRDYTLVLDEWMSTEDHMGMSSGDMSNMNHGSASSNGSSDHSNMSGMDHGSSTANQGSAGHGGTDHGSNTHGGSDHGQTASSSTVGHDMSMYDLFTINGNSGDRVKPLVVKKGERVRLRLVNAGYLSHQMHLHGHDFTIVATDGQKLNNPTSVKDQLISIAPGERYDVEFVANQPGEWYLEEHGENPATKGMKVKIQYEGEAVAKTDQPNENQPLSVFSFTSYGKKTDQTTFSLDQKYNLEYTMNLGTKDNGMKFTINDKTFPNTDPIKVKTGDLVKVKMVNTSKKDDHPMHLHGHFFQVLSKDGVPVQGSPIIKDTLNLKPGEEYVVAFRADNTGDWMFHCHDLHHASTGMVTVLKYTDFQSTFVADPNANNKPE